MTTSPRHFPLTLPPAFIGGFARVALALGFLSAVADRFGLWGSPGTEGIVWGAWEPFVDYVEVLNPWAPGELAWLLGVAATGLEIALALLLVVGWRLREVALASAALLGLFGLAMLVFTGPKGPLDYSVFAACAAALLLAEHSQRAAENPARTSARG